MKLKDKLINDLFFLLKEDEEWQGIMREVIINHNGSVHLAVFNEPFLSMIFDGSKTMESRFSINNVTPFSKVSNGDIVLVKKSGGDIVGLFLADEVKYFSNLTPLKLAELELKYGKQIGWYRDPEFLANKSTAKYLTLLTIEKLRQILPIETKKADRTAWTFLLKSLQNTLFQNKA